MLSIPIFLASDNNYAPFVATTIASICDNTKSFIDFYVLDGGVSKLNKQKICELKKQFNNFSIEFIKIDTEKTFISLQATHYISKSMYSRFLIPKVKTNIDKALYTDVDVLVLGDISEMYNEDIKDHALGAICQDYLSNQQKKSLTKRLDLSVNHSFFSSGNLILDCKKWREEDITEKLFELAHSLNESTIINDQDILNKHFENNYKNINTKYCYTMHDYINNTPDDIIIMHYNGSVKPWHIPFNADNSIFPKFKEFWKYMQRTLFYDEIHNQAVKNCGNMMRLLRVQTIKMKQECRNA